MFLKNPNLPETSVTHVAIGERAKNVIGALNEAGIETLLVARNKNLNENIADHADINLIHLGSNSFLSACDIEIEGADIKRVDLKADYPGDCLLNAALFGEYLFGNFSIIDNAILDHARQQRIRSVFVRQGYTKCGIAVVDENSIITEDVKIKEISERLEIGCLLITKGYVSLDGYDYGFIGGSCGKIAKDRLAFTGTLDEHPDRDKILSFLNRRYITPVYLTDKPCFDIGGILPLREERFHHLQNNQ